MRNVKAYINSSSRDTKQRWGMVLAETSVTALMTPAPLKSYITNKSALSNGKQVLTDSGNVPKVDERDVQLVFAIHAHTLAKFLMQYHAFCDELKKGAIDLTLHVWEGDSYIKTTYYLNYVSCSQFSEYNGRLGRFVLKLNEPNPTNRTIEHSSDIEL